LSEVRSYLQEVKELSSGVKGVRELEGVKTILRR